MNILFQVKGGVGKNIAATAVIKGLNKKYPKSKIIVIASSPDVFINNPYVEKTYPFHQVNGIYQKYLHNQKHKVFVNEPYESPLHFEKNQHLIKTWFDICGLEYKDEQPEIYLMGSELEYYQKAYSSSPKPILALHCNGGPQEQNSLYSWTRDIPFPNVMDIIDYYKNDFTIVHIKQPWQATYENTFPAMGGIREIGALLTLSYKRLLIDSFSQHLSAALGLSSTVCWGITSPKIFGYKIHDNILANPYTKDPDYSNSMLHDWDLFEPLDRMPYWSLNEIFDSEKIIKSLNK